MTVTRLPVQHKNAPHCPKCKRDVPTFDNLLMQSFGDIPLPILAITIHTRCTCGMLLDLRKNIRET